MRRSAVVRNATDCIEKAKPRGISPILELNLFVGASRFWQGAFPLRQHHLRTCTRCSLCFRKICLSPEMVDFGGQLPHTTVSEGQCSAVSASVDNSFPTPRRSARSRSGVAGVSTSPCNIPHRRRSSRSQNLPVRWLYRFAQHRPYYTSAALADLWPRHSMSLPCVASVVAKDWKGRPSRPDKAE